MSEAWRGRRVLITGGLGFIGSNLALRLVGDGAQVSIIDLPLAHCAGDLANISTVADRVNVLRTDLAVPGDWSEKVAQAEFVFHLAGQVSHAASMTAPASDLDQNCRSLLNVLEAAKRSPRPPKIIFTSTRQVYGRAEFLPVTEAHPLHPPDINGVHKVAAEGYLRIYREVAGVQSTVVRLANTYGPRMDLRNPGRGVLNVFLARALRGEPLTIFGDGSQRRDLNFVDDVTDALLRAALLDNPRPFHLGHKQPTSLREFVETLSQMIPVTFELRPFPPDLQAIDIGDSHCDISRFQSATGWTPRTSLADGLKATLEYFRGQPL